MSGLLGSGSQPAPKVPSCVQGSTFVPHVPPGFYGSTRGPDYDLQQVVNSAIPSLQEQSSYEQQEAHDLEADELEADDLDLPLYDPMYSAQNLHSLDQDLHQVCSTNMEYRVDEQPRCSSASTSTPPQVSAPNFSQVEEPRRNPFPEVPVFRTRLLFPFAFVRPATDVRPEFPPLPRPAPHIINNASALDCSSRVQLVRRPIFPSPSAPDLINNTSAQRTGSNSAALVRSNASSEIPDMSDSLQAMLLGGSIEQPDDSISSLLEGTVPVTIPKSDWDECSWSELNDILQTPANELDPCQQQNNSQSMAPSMMPMLSAPVSNKKRLRWTTHLHGKFATAVAKLGGPMSATPKSVLRLMECQDVNIHQVKSHLQKYRLTPNMVPVDMCRMDRRRNYEQPGGVQDVSAVEIQTENLRMQMVLQKQQKEFLEDQKELHSQVHEQGLSLQRMMYTQTRLHQRQVEVFEAQALGYPTVNRDPSPVLPSAPADTANSCQNERPAADVGTSSSSSSADPPKGPPSPKRARRDEVQVPHLVLVPSCEPYHPSTEPPCTESGSASPHYTDLTQADGSISLECDEVMSTYDAPLA